MSKRIFFKAFVIMAAFIAVLLIFSGVLLGQGPSNDAVFEHVKAIHDKHTAHLLEIEGVVGTAIGLDPNDQLSIKVFLVGPKVTGIPRNLEGVPTQVVVTGKFRALAQRDNPLAKPAGSAKINPAGLFPRPVPIGVSTGNVGECLAGTIGCRVKDTLGNVYALSNNHVFALENYAVVGSEISQPGLYDTGCSYDPYNVIGTLAAFEPIYFGGYSDNTIDAAIAFSSNANLGNATPSNGYGKPKSSAVEAYLNQKVQKYGRTTALTRGTVTGINANIWINYDSGLALFTGQIIVQSGKPFIKAGDSGSLLVADPGRQPVGLLYAGDASGKYAIANRIAPVLSRFNVTVDGE
jgi:hypothetical protein